jgi:hypothetical protein
MNAPLRMFLASLIQAHWKVRMREAQTLNLSRHFLLRYPAIPGEYMEFLTHVGSCMANDETVWFLCEDDYNQTTDSAFQWNDFEVQSLEAAGTDEHLKSHIMTFWDQHLPIALSVKSQYAFLCILLTRQDYGAIALGHEPEYEEVEIICGSFGELTALIAATLNGKLESHVLNDFV